ncbi:hypothetical protein [Yersinia pekkanenii]|uniref:Uncharacterized protein n=1 Tax=Yersinia pekkanenii TaxID=1288385 RepID=A0A0T9RS63_9GAMM|nr:hypothetical protein [Yersinia pekkanenii]CNI78652.1 Uncharacterised protein [Yersinia pekkanenii]CRY69615.1 Uncharacterised protein [Yersinia pekkanenii]
MDKYDYRALLTNAHKNAFSVASQINAQKVNQCLALIHQSIYTGYGETAHQGRDRLINEINKALE